MSKPRVVVTGMGAVSPLGLSGPETWNSAIEGKSGMAPITLFDTKDCPVTFAAECKGFDVSKPLSRPIKSLRGEMINEVLNTKDARKFGRFCHLGLAAGLEAYANSGLENYPVNPERIGVNIGAGLGGLPEIEAVHDDFRNKGYRRITPFFILQTIPNMISGQLSILLGLKGPNLCNITACSSSAHSIGEAFKQIQRGDADLMIAGGAESVISPLGIGGFAAMRALSTRNDAPAKASRPFDKDRDGFVMGEGAAALVLEEYEHAKKRGAKIYAEVCGYGLTGDAYHVTSPAPEGEGGKRAMQMALRDADLKPEQIAYINAHGTSTPAGDTEEAKAVASLFPDHKNHLHVSSTKSMTGHLLGAAGAIEGFFSIMAICEGKIPPTINCENMDPECLATGINFTVGQAVKKEVKYALSNSFGFGGTNASLIFGKI